MKEKKKQKKGWTIKIRQAGALGSKEISKEDRRFTRHGEGEKNKQKPPVQKNSIVPGVTATVKTWGSTQKGEGIIFP